ncbi:signal peptidase I [uncultured Nocardioides sp.]|uniref:signal peptidase I n=1 Tax=uncultured Nocardioides sp. TaxID=198441 RepID=UPI00263049B2|nr:signal peptidase I [uncultured Nocardioides sp.]
MTTTAPAPAVPTGDAVPSPRTASHGRHRRRRVLSVLWSGACWTVVLAAAAVVVVAVLVPRAAGATPYTVLTGSMTPTYPPGTLVVVRPERAEDLAVGDVITYQRSSGESTVVTHRIVAVATGTVDGERFFRTRGDANDAVDTDPVQPVQVKGAVWYAVPWLGHLNSWLSGGQRQWASYGVGAGLVVYALVMGVGGFRDRRRRRRGATS